jgi:malonate decarboxylase beta subunit
MTSYYEAGARDRVAGLLDPGSFEEILPPEERVVSPHLRELDTPAAFDDGIVVGSGRLVGRRVFVAAQEGGFMGGAVGEVHGAKLVGLLERALDQRPDGVLLAVESGGVRLHEANAGLIAVSEIMRAILALRTVGVPVVVLDGGPFGCFGGMGITARLCDAIVISEEGRLGLSGPEVIETTCGVEEFDSRDRALVWRTVGGKHRYLLGEADEIVADDIAAFRRAASAAFAAHDHASGLSLEALSAEHRALGARIERFGACRDALDIWRDLGFADPDGLPLLEADAFRDLTHDRRA